MREEDQLGNILKSLRSRRGWTQDEAAKELVFSRHTYSDWETGKRFPTPKQLQRIASKYSEYGLSQEEEDALYRAAWQAPLIQEPPTIHNLLPRNLFFTGREGELEQLDELLQETGTAAITQPISISGLGGIGKTQLALEYAYRHQDDYRYVLWVRADTRETLISGLVTVAGLLNLAEKDVQDQKRVVDAVWWWLATNPGWLLIFDNADDLEMAHEFLPTGGKGHVLLTTRAYSTGGIAQRVEVEEMEPEQGALFLLRRAGTIRKNAPLSEASQVDSTKAKEISEAMDGLPLALDQAGAFIEETGCGLDEYFTIYREQRAELLKQRGGIASPHPEPVATTWSLSFEKVAKANVAAADLLRFFAFLHPEAIPEELITEGAAELGAELKALADDAVKLNRAIGELLKYSLVRRDAKAKTLSVHRLVQAVLIDAMPPDLQKQWRERVVRALNAAFPKVEFEVWKQCERLLPHALGCVAWSERELDPLLETARLFQEASDYLQQHGRYPEAELSVSRMLTIVVKLLGAEHPDVAACLEMLAGVYWSQLKIEQAEAIFQKASAIREKHLVSGHPPDRYRLQLLGMHYTLYGKYEDAERLLLQALSIIEQEFGAEHPDVAACLEMLAMVYREQDKDGQAELLYRQAITIWDKLEVEHPAMASPLHGLAQLMQFQGEREQAKALYQRALSIQERLLGPKHPDTQQTKKDYAKLLRSIGRSTGIE